MTSLDVDDDDGVDEEPEPRPAAAPRPRGSPTPVGEIDPGAALLAALRDDEEILEGLGVDPAGYAGVLVDASEAGLLPASTGWITVVKNGAKLVSSRLRLDANTRQQHQRQWARRHRPETAAGGGGSSSTGRHGGNGGIEGTRRHWRHTAAYGGNDGERLWRR